MKTIIPIELNGGELPTKGSEQSAAFDVFCPMDFELTKPRNVVPLGFCIQLPPEWKANMRPRSGFSAKGFVVRVRTTYCDFKTHKMYDSVTEERIDADVLLGLVDSDYRDEVGVILKVYDMNVVAPKKQDFDWIIENHVFIHKGERFAQMEICGGPCELQVVEKIVRDTDRGGGFGHTGA